MISSSSLEWKETHMIFRDVEAKGGEGEVQSQKVFCFVFESDLNDNKINDYLIYADIQTQAAEDRLK